MWKGIEVAAEICVDDVSMASVSQLLKLLCLNRKIGNLSAIQEKSGYLLRQRGNEPFVSNPKMCTTKLSHSSGFTPVVSQQLDGRN